jgi:hypothetical protein
LCCMVRLMAEAPVQVQKTCSRSCSACAARGDVAECCQPQEQAVPRFMGHPWPPAPTTPCWSRRHQTSFQLFSHGSLHLGVHALGAPLWIARAVRRASSCGWVGAAKVIADSVHRCLASILAVWLGCMRKFVAARTVKVEELRLSEPSNDCIAPRWCCWSCWGCCLAGGMWGSHFVCPFVIMLRRSGGDCLYIPCLRCRRKLLWCCTLLGASIGSSG